MKGSGLPVADLGRIWIALITAVLTILILAVLTALERRIETRLRL